MIEKKLQIMSCLLSFVLGVGGYGISQIFEKEPECTVYTENGGMVLSEETTGYGISLLSARIAAEDYEDYGVSPLAENAYTLTATITPADATNKKVDWSIAFANASSEWATGKTVTDYVTVTPSADGALTAVVENVAEFGEPIVVKCTSRDNSSAYATCVIHYLQRTISSGFSLVGVSYSTKGGTQSALVRLKASAAVPLEFFCSKSKVYTRANTDKGATYFTIKPTAAFKTVITNAGFNASNLMEYSASNKESRIYYYLDSHWGEALYSNSAEKNKFIDTLIAFRDPAYEVNLYTSKNGVKLATINVVLSTIGLEGQKDDVSNTVN